MGRRLAAILAADVVGYSRLIRDDEARTLAALKAHLQELIEPKIAERNGRIVKLMGDGLLAEFPSAVEAVQCAVEIQHWVGGHNAEVPKGRRIDHRIGINIGDIVVDGDDIYGDGVNVAARLEGLAEPGGICISQSVHAQVHDKLDLNFESRGEQEVKNIAEPITAYRVVLDAQAVALVTPVVRRSAKRASRRWVATAAAAAGVLVVAAGGALWWQPWAPDVDPASVEKMALPVSDKPSIAVLPFVSLSDDPEQAYFADGLTEDLITDLAKFPDLLVTARTSVSAYKGKTLDVRKISQELGVRYLLEGSVEQSPEKIRVTAQLIDATTAGHLWANRFERDRTDLFAIRNEISAAIASALTGNTGALTKAVVDKALQRSPERLRARDLYYRALSHWPKFTKEDNAEARRLLEESIALDPNDAQVHAQLSWTHWRDDWIGWTEDSTRSRRLAVETAKRAVALDASNYRAHWALGAALRLSGNLDAAAQRYERAFDLNPNDPDLLADWGELLRDSGNIDESIIQLTEAMRLNPHYPDWYVNVLTTAYFLSGRYEDTVRTGSRILDPIVSIRAEIAASYIQLGQLDKAKMEVEQILQVDPHYSISKSLEWTGWDRVDDGVLATYKAALRQAGMPE